MNFKLKQKTIENLKIYSQILNKSINELIEEALDEYFASLEERLLKDNIENENAQTNLSFNEFWDGVDID